METVSELLTELAATLGTTIEYLWMVLIQQARVFVITYPVWVVLAFTFFMFFLRNATKAIKGWDEFTNDETIKEPILETTLSIIFGALTVILLIVCLSQLELFITALLNPEYYALEKILNHI